MSCEPTLHAVLEDICAMETEIDERGNGENGKEGKHRACRARGFLEGLGSASGSQLAGGLEDEEANGGEDGSGGGVEDALESVNAKGIGERDFILARNEQRAERFSDATQNEECAEAGEVHGVDVPEAGRADMSLESLPAPGANGITEIDGHNGEKQIGVIGAANGVPELYAAELAEME